MDRVLLVATEQQRLVGRQQWVREKHRGSGATERGGFFLGRVLALRTLESYPLPLFSHL